MKKKIAILLEAPSVIGGIQSAAERHIKILKDQYDFLPIFLEKSKKEKDWKGKVQKVQGKIFEGYLLTASDLDCDHQWSNNSSIENVRFDQRFRTWGDLIVKVCREEKVDEITSFGLFHQRGLLAAFAGSKLNIPYHLCFRGTDLETRMFESALPQLGFALNSAKSAVTVSQDSMDLMETLFKPTCQKHVIRNHFDPEIFTEQKLDLPLLDQTNLPVIGYFGKFRRITGIDFLLEAFDLVCEQKPAILFMVGNYRKQEARFYNGLMEKMKYLHHVVRVPYAPHSQMISYLKKCDLVAFPSLSDSSPNKVLEAMYAEVPIVSTQISGIPELVTHDKEALLVEPRNTEALAEAILKVLNEKETRNKLVQGAKKRVMTEFDPKNEALLWRQVYQ